MKMLKQPLIFLMLLLCMGQAIAKEDKWYRVEMIIFEMQDKNGLTAQNNLGTPSFANAISLNTEPNADFSLLTDKQLSLHDAKQRIQKRYPLIMHKGWRQLITDKEHAQKVHVTSNINNNEVDGIVRLSMGRNLNVDTDLLFRKTGSDNTFRLKETSRLRADEITYIDHPNYGVLVMVSPEKTATVKPATVAQKPVEAVKAKAPTAEEEDNDKPILPSQREALIKRGA